MMNAGVVGVTLTDDPVSPDLILLLRRSRVKISEELVSEHMADEVIRTGRT